MDLNPARIEFPKQQFQNMMLHTTGKWLLRITVHIVGLGQNLNV